jgi:RNA polymerase sigma-70 factor (ECF subfamily)
LLKIVRPSFDDRTWAAFTRVALDGRPAAEVAAELGTSKNAVNMARHRILTHLRREADGLLD